MANELTGFDAEIIEPSNALAMSRAELDMQIVTARRFPRDIKLVRQEIIDMSTIDEETAEENIFALPRAGKPIQGPSVRFAEIIESCFGNCRTAARVIEVDRKEGVVVAEGIFHDIEKNKARRAEIRRSIRDKKGRIYSNDMIIVTGNAACAIALRNAILAGVPRVLWREAYERCREMVAGDVDTLAETRDRAIKALAHYGVTPEQIVQALGVKEVGDIDRDHIPILRGMYASIKNGESTVEEVFNFGRQTVSEPDRDFNPMVNQKKENIDPETGEIKEEESSSSNDDDKTKIESTETKTEKKPKTEVQENNPADKIKAVETQPQNEENDDLSPPFDLEEDEAATNAENPVTRLTKDIIEAYSKALRRATQPKSLASFRVQFLDGKGYNFSAENEKLLSRVYTAHLRFVTNELNEDGLKDEIENIIKLIKSIT